LQDYNQNKDFEAACLDVGARFLEAPITGGMDALKKGQMVAWVAGDKEAYEKVRINKMAVEGGLKAVMSDNAGSSQSFDHFQNNEKITQNN